MNTQRLLGALGVVTLTACLTNVAATQDRQAPHLRKQGTATQLIVDGSPFLIRGGELGNSSASSLSWLAPHWKTFRDLRLNTIVAPVYWDLVEPAEGRFDWTLVDGLIAEARKNEMRLVLLWFGAGRTACRATRPSG